MYMHITLRPWLSTRTPPVFGGRGIFTLLTFQLAGADLDLQFMNVRVLCSLTFRATDAIQQRLPSSWAVW